MDPEHFEIIFIVFEVINKTAAISFYEYIVHGRNERLSNSMPFFISKTLHFFDSSIEIEMKLTVSTNFASEFHDIIPNSSQFPAVFSDCIFSVHACCICHHVCCRGKAVMYVLYRCCFCYCLSTNDGQRWSNPLILCTHTELLCLPGLNSSFGLTENELVHECNYIWRPVYITARFL